MASTTSESAPDVETTYQAENERKENDDHTDRDDFMEDISLIVNIINGIASEIPKEVDEARCKAQDLIDCQELEDSREFGDYSEIKQIDAKELNATFKNEAKEEEEVSDVNYERKYLSSDRGENEISEADFWRDLSAEEIQRRKGNWQERKVQSDVLRQHGNICCVKNEFEEAVRCYSEAIDLIRDSASLYSSRALALIKLGKYEAAVEDCNKAVFISRFSLKARLYKAKALYLSYEYTRCLACLQEARHSLPNFHELIDDCQRKLFETDDPPHRKAKDLGDVFPTEKFLRLAAKYDLSKMTTFFDESPVAKDKKR